MRADEHPNIAVSQYGWWTPACAALGIDAPVFPVAKGLDGNAYAATLDARIKNGGTVLDALSGQSPEYLIDNGGTGLAFIRSGDNRDDAQLVHERLGAILCSHFIDPITTAMQGLDWSITWQCLKSDRWVKAVWDIAQVLELRRFGIPNVFHLPMAAVDRAYDTTPLDPDQCEEVVSFVGGQNTSFFDAGSDVPANVLVPGVIAQAVNADIPEARFLDVFYDLYKLASPPAPDDPIEEQIRKTAEYFNAKLFFNAALCIRNRDRFVIFLKQNLGDRFRVVGRRWDSTYGLATEPPVPSADGYLERLRRSAININLVNGNAETSVNMRHFEITAAGGFMLCHDRPELRQYFDVGKECVAFTNERDLLEKIDYYLNRPDERVAIAHAGQQRTLSEHLHRHRLKTLLGALTPGSESAPFDKHAVGV